MKIESIIITLTLLPETEIADYQEFHIKSELDMLQGAISERGVKIIGSHYRFIPATPPTKTVHAPDCSGAWCDGYCD